MVCLGNILVSEVNENNRAGSDNAAKVEAVQESPAQAEVRTEREANPAAPANAFQQIGNDSAALQNQGKLPVFGIEGSDNGKQAGGQKKDAPAGDSRAVQGVVADGDKQGKIGSAGDEGGRTPKPGDKPEEKKPPSNAAGDMITGFEIVDDEDADSPDDTDAGKKGGEKEKDGVGRDRRSDRYERSDGKHAPDAERRSLVASAQRCNLDDAKVSGDRMVPVLEVKFAGLPEHESNGSLSAAPVRNNDLSGERTLVTTTHGLVPLKNQAETPYKFLDKGFSASDSNNDGTLDREELNKQIRENAPDSSTRFQAQYILDNYDKIAARSKELDPSAKGITNDGLAQHYMENAKITVRTAAGQSFPAQLVSGNRDTDVAVLRASGLNQEQYASLGRNFEVSRSNPQAGDVILPTGHAGGKPVADARCFSPRQSIGSILGERTGEPGSLISGRTDATQAQIARGMSGGPVLDNRRDHVIVGLNHSTLITGTEARIVPASAIQDELRKARLKR